MPFANAKGPRLIKGFKKRLNTKHYDRFTTNNFYGKIHLIVSVESVNFACCRMFGGLVGKARAARGAKRQAH
jgi:hypothetical protein